jgi:putative membrane protein
MKRTLGLSVVALALAASPAFAQATTQSKTKAEGTATAKASADQTFVMNAAKGGMAEVELGKLAAQKASNDEVKKFGQRMADDHGKANDELKAIASSKNITLPQAMDAKDKALQDRLSKLSGAAFDRAYMAAMLRDHRQDVNAFKRESTAGKDPEIKAFASKTLPTLEDHLKLAQTTDRAVVGTSGNRAGRSAGTAGKSNPNPNGASNPASANPNANPSTPPKK